MTMARTRGISRRGLLGSLAAGGAAARLLPFMPVAARAADGAPPKRLLCVFHPMGWLENDFFPRRTSDTDFTLGPSVAALEAWKSKLIFLDGLMLYGAEWFFPDDDNEHGSGGTMAFTGSKKMGFSSGPSIDGAVASALAGQGVATPYKSLGLGVNTPAPSPHSSCFFSAAQQPVNAQNSPKAAFDLIFKNVTGTGGPAIDLAALARVRKQKQSVIDLVRGDLTSACGRIGAAEKDKCDAHLQGIRDIENRLAKDPGAPTVSGCVKPAAPVGGDLAATVHQQMDVLTAALSCDLTRVVTLQLGFCDGGLTQIPGLNHHDTTHATGDTKGNPAVIADHQKIDRWHADRFAYLLGKLDSVKEGNGTLLDNTLVLFGSDTTTGQSLQLGAHMHWRFPFFLAGGSNFAFKTGRALKFAMPKLGNMEDSKRWVVHNRLLTSVANAFAMNVNSFGTMDPGTGPLPML
jgi:hypothetical protein